MPPLSQLMQMGPGNIFGGLGKNLGAGIGGGITKQIRRPLFNKLVDKFRTGNEDKARLSTLAQMGLTAAPMQGSEQYPIFEQMLEANQNLLNQRADRSQELWETDPTAAREYLLGEQAMKFGGTGAITKPSKSELAAGAEGLREVMMDANTQATRAEFAIGRDQSDVNWAEYEKAVDALDRAAADYTVAAVGSGLDASKVLPQSVSQRMTRMKSLLETRNVAGQGAARVNSAVSQVLAAIDKKATGFAAKVKPALEEMRKIFSAQKDVEGLLANYEAIKKDPNALFQAIKRLAQAIEPGLQVTEGEVAGFAGENFFTKTLGLIASAKSGIPQLFKSLPKVQVASGRQSEELLKKVLGQATRTIRSTQEANASFINEYALSAAATMAKDTGIRLENNKLIPKTGKDQIIQHAQDKVLGELPLGMLDPSSFITKVEAVLPQLGGGGISTDLMGKAKALIAQSEAFLKTDKGADPEREKLRVQIEKTKEATKKEDAKAIEQEVGFLGQIINALLGLETDENGNSTLKVENLNVAGIPLGDQQVRVSAEEADELLNSGEY